MSKIFVHAALGALVGASASILIDKAQKREELGAPVLPSALLSAAASLLPVARAAAQHVVETIDGLGLPSMDNKDEVNASAADVLAPAPGHPAGADFAPTPK